MIIEELKSYTDADFDVLCTLMSALSSHCRLTRADVDAVLHDPGSHLFVARTEETIIGTCTVGLYTSPTGTKACLEDVVVAEQCRGLGTGRKLVQHAVDFLRSRGVRQLLFTSRPSRVAANTLYRSMGFGEKETNVYVQTF